MTFNSPRPYRSARRAEGAANTRSAIFGAATRLFVERGYGRVTVSEIANAAGVAMPTVYASTGGKETILTTIIEEAMADPVVDSTLDAVRSAATGAKVIEVTTRGTRIDNERHHEMIQVMVSAAETDETANSARLDSDRVYRETLDKSIDRLVELGHLSPRVDHERASGILWFYLGHRSWHLNVIDLGLSWDQTEEWLCEQTKSALLDPGYHT